MKWGVSAIKQYAREQFLVREKLSILAALHELYTPDNHHSEFVREAQLSRDRQLEN